jgi:hypothetical protein
MGAPDPLDHRYRDDNGRIHAKRGDTLVHSLRDIYGDDFAKGHRADMRLDTLLDVERCDSLSQYLKKNR